MKNLFESHINRVTSLFDEILDSENKEVIIVDSGELECFFADDQHKPFKPTPIFNFLCPLTSPGHVITYRKGDKLKLFYFQPDDFWYDVLAPEQSYWNDSFDIEIHQDEASIWKPLQGMKSSIYLGSRESRSKELGFSTNPETVISRLDWERSFKTPYEVACIEKAEEIAAKGHIAARDSFLRGESELEIHQNYMQAIEAIEANLPYWSIVALNEKAAVLHYESKRPVRDGSVLLIDSGAQYKNYCSDITRTYATEKAHPTFHKLLTEMNSAQLRLCDAVKPGTPYPELHHQANVEIFNILNKFEIVKDVSLDEAIDNGIVRTFFPHGLGHMLGIQVHDTGGHLSGPDGSTNPPPEKYPKLRTTRTLDEGVVLTIEPGLYFIPSLLRKAKESSYMSKYNWTLIDELTPCGGIRIEDNIVVESSGARNLTRPHLPN